MSLVPSKGAVVVTTNAPRPQTITVTTGIQGPPGRSGAFAMRRFSFPTPSLLWQAEHNYGTDMLICVARDAMGRILNAQVDVNPEELSVKLTSATAGYVDALFNEV